MSGAAPAGVSPALWVLLDRVTAPEPFGLLDDLVGILGALACYEAPDADGTDPHADLVDEAHEVVDELRAALAAERRWPS